MMQDLLTATIELMTVTTALYLTACFLAGFYAHCKRRIEAQTIDELLGIAASPQTTDYDNLNIRCLKAIASLEGIKGFGKLRKNELMEVLAA